MILAKVRPGIAVAMPLKATFGKESYGCNLAGYCMTKWIN